MSIDEWLNQSLYTWTGDGGLPYTQITVGGIVGSVIAAIVILAVARLARIALARYHAKHHLESELISFVRRMITIASVVIWLILSMSSIHFNPTILSPSSEGFNLSFRSILLAVLCVVVARIADKIISARLLEEFESQTQKDIYHDQYGAKNKSNITGTVRNALFIIVGIILLSSTQEFNVEMTIGKIMIRPTNILLAILVILIARLLLWMVVNLFLYGFYKREQIDIGKQYAYNQLLSYVVYFLAIVFALKWMDIDLTLLLAGAAALLVGIGIALQQVISDFFSGLVILFERSVEVGDFLDFGEYRGTVKKIGLRASIVETIDLKDIIIPNTHLVNERVTNWSSTRTITRFAVGVGVAYGTDTSEAKRLLILAAHSTEGILDAPIPFVRLTNFGDSSLDLSLIFFSEEVRSIEDIKSNLRFEIDHLFRSHDIDIPFPQRDMHLKK